MHLVYAIRDQINVLQLHRSNGAVTRACKERKRDEGAVTALDLRTGRHRRDDMLPVPRWARTFPASRRDGRILVRKV